MNATVAGGGRRSGQHHHHHHQRQHSDNFFLESAASSTGGGNKWLQNLQSSSTAATVPPPLQQVEYSRMLRSMQRGTSGDFMQTEPSTPPVCSRTSSSRRNVDDVSPIELSPGILDLHSFDTDLLTEMAYDRNRGFDDSDNMHSASKLANKSRPLQENNQLKGSSADKEKSCSVAKIKVVVRKRPLNKKEMSKKEEDIISTTPCMNSLTVHETKLKVDLTEYLEKHEFVFDSVLDENVSNDKVYHETVEPIVPLIFQRTKATCFAYGQTGSGKTYTMQPLPLKASQDILRLMNNTYRNQGFHLFVSFFEIYGGKLFDLLNDRRKLCMREDGKQQVCIVGLQEFSVSNVDTIRELIEKGNATRSTGTTGANEESSRSHAILQLAIKRSSNIRESKPARIVGKLSFIDLAGSERGADTTDNDKQTRIEGAEINKSLLALKECIRALDNDQVHIPFRGSKLTEVLRDSFIGDSRTVMISCISPNSGSCEHTLNTLRYADRVKSLSKGNNPKKDVTPTVNLRESSLLPLASIADAVDCNDVDFANETNRFGSSRQSQNEASLPFTMDQGLDRGEEGQFPPVSENYYRDHRRRTSITGNDFGFPEPHEWDKSSWRKVNQDKFVIPGLDDKPRKNDTITKHKKASGVDTNSIQSDDDLNALLKEEEELVNAHRKEVEETIDIVREEMKLLVDADQPGNQLDEYISRLNTILSQKAAGIVSLQMRLANFQRLLTENNVLVSS